MNEGTSNDSSASDLMEVWNMWVKCHFKGLHRDKSIDVRYISVTELSLWASNSPEILLEVEYKSFVLGHLLDPTKKIRHKAYETIFSLLAKPYNLGKQKELFLSIKSHLFYVLDGEDAEMALRIFCKVVSFLKPELGTDLVKIYKCIYAEDQVISYLAGLFLFKHHFQRLANSPNKILCDLLKFHLESGMKPETLLIDSMYKYINEFLTWESWFNFVTSVKTETFLDALALFLAYVQKAVTGYIPKQRAVNPCWEVPEDKLKTNSKEFDEYFSVHWFELMSFDKIESSGEALTIAIKLTEYFSAFISPNVQLQIVKNIFNKMSNWPDKGLIMTSSESLSILHSKAKEFQGKEEIETLQSVIDYEINEMVNEFLDLMRNPNLYLERPERPGPVEFRVLALCKYHNVRYKYIWDACNQGVLSGNRGNIADEELLIVLLTIQYQLVMRKAKQITECKNDEASFSLPEMEVDCVVMANSLQRNIEPFLKNPSKELRKLAFYIVVEILEYLGPHMSHHPSYWSLQILTFSDSTIGDIINYPASLIPNSEQQESDKVAEDFCRAVNKICSLLSRGYLDILNLTPLIQLLDKTTLHREEMISCVKDCLTLTPNKWRRLAIAVFNALINLLTEEVHKGHSIDSSIKKLQDVLEALLDVSKIKKELMRPLILKLHMLIISHCHGPRGCRQLTMLLYTLRPTITDTDISYVLSEMEKVNCVEFTRFKTFALESFSGRRSSSRQNKKRKGHHTTLDFGSDMSLESNDTLQVTPASL